MATPIRSRELQIIGAPEGWFPRLLPPNMQRSQCPPRSPDWPCQYVLCTANLQLVPRAQRAGRYRDGIDDMIKCQSPSCLYDVINANPAGMSARRIAKVLKMTDGSEGSARFGRRRVEQIVKAALEGPLSKVNRDDLDDEHSGGRRGLHTSNTTD